MEVDSEPGRGVPLDNIADPKGGKRAEAEKFIVKEETVEKKSKDERKKRSRSRSSDSYSSCSDSRSPTKKRNASPPKDSPPTAIKIVGGEKLEGDGAEMNISKKAKESGAMVTDFVPAFHVPISDAEMERCGELTHMIADAILAGTMTRTSLTAFASGLLNIAVSPTSIGKK